MCVQFSYLSLRCTLRDPDPFHELPGYSFLNLSLDFCKGWVQLLSLMRPCPMSNQFRSDQITLHLFQPHQADQMFDPHLMGSSQQAYYDINDIISILVSGVKPL